MSLLTASPLSFASSLFSRATNSAAGAKVTTPSTGSTSSPGTSTPDIGSTFLSLLVQELQNQDPTAPMDSTAMVGQMISLNQLNQLTSIDQVLSKAYGTTSGSSASAAKSAITNITALPATQAALRLLNSNAVNQHPAVSSSVTLPAS